jgi:arylsulfatase A-like enzyme
MAPTFLEAAGIAPLPVMTGRSFLPVLKSAQSGQIDPKRDRIIVGKERHDMGRPGDVGYPVRAIRTKQYLYVRNFEPTRWPACDPETGYRNIDDSPTKRLLLDQKEAGDYRYYELSMGKRPAEELYDLAKDPSCMENLADRSELAAVKTQLWNEMRATLEAQKDPRILGNGAIFDGYKYVGSRAHAWDTIMGTKKP